MITDCSVCMYWNSCEECNSTLKYPLENACVDCSQVFYDCQECSPSQACFKCQSHFFLRGKECVGCNEISDYCEECT